MRERRKDTKRGEGGRGRERGRERDRIRIKIKELGVMVGVVWLWCGQTTSSDECPPTHCQHLHRVGVLSARRPCGSRSPAAVAVEDADRKLLPRSSAAVVGGVLAAPPLPFVLPTVDCVRVHRPHCHQHAD